MGTIEPTLSVSEIARLYGVSNAVVYEHGERGDLGPPLPHRFLKGKRYAAASIAEGMAKVRRRPKIPGGITAATLREQASRLRRAADALDEAATAFDVALQFPPSGQFTAGVT